MTGGEGESWFSSGERLQLLSSHDSSELFGNCVSEGEGRGVLDDGERKGLADENTEMFQKRASVCCSP